MGYALSHEDGGGGAIPEADKLDKILFNAKSSRTYMREWSMQDTGTKKI